MTEPSKGLKIATTIRAVKRRRLAQARAATALGGTPGINAGRILASDRARPRTMRLFGVTASAGGIIGDPSHAIARDIRNALTRPASGSTVTVYDAAGRAVATIDPFTRKRTPLIAAAAAVPAGRAP